MRKVGAVLVVLSLAACSIEAGGVLVDAGFDAGPDAYASPYDAAAPSDVVVSDVAPAGDAADAAPPCPTNLPGPALVHVADAGCIDSTEVSNAQYDLYRSAYDAGWGTGDCAWINETPSGTSPGNGNDNKPVTNVHWCDASLYCKWAGKHLCGSRNGGGGIAGADVAKASVSEWFNACSSGGTSAYPYGAQYVKTNCNTEFQKGGTVAVGSLSSCVGPKGVFDLSGNVREWIDSCDGPGRYANCQYMNGDFYTGQNEAQCSHADHATRDATWANSIGFRCCY